MAEGPPQLDLPGEISKPLDRWLRHGAQLDLFDARPDHRHPTLGPYLGEHARMGKCFKVRLPKKDGTGDVVLERTETGAWRIEGLVVCHTWQCAVCGAQRARNAAAILSTAIPLFRRRSTDADVWMFSPTIHHTRDESMASKTARLYAAWDTFSASKAWGRFVKQFGIRAVVRCFDDSFERSYHPHFHVLLFVDDAPHVVLPEEPWELDPSEAAIEFRSGDARVDAMREFLRLAPMTPMRAAPRALRNAKLADLLRTWGLIDAWERACRATGVFPVEDSKVRGFREHALQLQGGEDAAAYVVKWGLADEAVRSPDKESSHVDLLNRYLAGDVAAGAMYREWADATRGRHFVTGLGKLRTFLAITDEQIDEHMAEQRRRRDVDDERNGVERIVRTPMRLVVSPFLWPAAVSLGWARIIDTAQRAELAGEEPRAAVDRMLILVRMSSRAGPGPDT